MNQEAFFDSQVFCLDSLKRISVFNSFYFFSSWRGVQQDLTGNFSSERALRRRRRVRRRGWRSWSGWWRGWWTRTSSSTGSGVRPEGSSSIRSGWHFKRWIHIWAGSWRLRLISEAVSWLVMITHRTDFYFFAVRRINVVLLYFAAGASQWELSSGKLWRKNLYTPFSFPS